MYGSFLHAYSVKKCQISQKIYSEKKILPSFSLKFFALKTMKKGIIFKRGDSPVQKNHTVSSVASALIFL